MQLKKTVNMTVRVQKVRGSLFHHQVTLESCALAFEMLRLRVPCCLFTLA